MRTPLVAANWKMFKTTGEIDEYIKDFLAGIADINDIDIVICPPFTGLHNARLALKNSRVRLGAQNLFWEKQGAYTGEISAPMLLDLECAYVIIGHSERRQLMGETNADINKKIKAALATGLVPIFCIGETLAQRDKGLAQDVVREQLESGLENVSCKSRGLVIAYEPVWAIGTGLNANPEDAQEMSKYIREYLTAKYDQALAESIPVLYGGSVKPDNISGFMAKDDIDGALVGGASLNAGDFANIVRKCR